MRKKRDERERTLEIENWGLRILKCKLIFKILEFFEEGK